MKCIICDSKCSYFFSKEYTEAPFNDFMRDIGPVDYFKCEHCGFVLSKTHMDLENAKWNNLNDLFHHFIEDVKNEKKGNQPPYAEQAMMINLLSKKGIIDVNTVVDFAAGYGTLSKILSKYHSINLPIFDPYIQSENSNQYINLSELKTYKTVINSAFFEHVLRRNDLDQVDKIVDKDGCLIIHTVICERIPNDPNWFYLWPPVHTAFHTNKSMAILMEQWGYSSSIYCPQSKCWVLLKTHNHTIEEKIEALNQELQNTWFYFKKGFVDYWKGF